MKILYHHRIRSKDGQFVHIEELTRALAAAGHEIIMVGPGAVERETFGADAGGVAWLKRYLPRAFYELLELGYAVVDYVRLARAARRHRPDVVYERYNLYLPSGIWVKRQFRVPLLLEVNAPLCDERRRYSGIALGWLARWSERMAWRGADYVLPVTRVLAERVQQEGVPPERIAVIPNGINVERFMGGAPSLEEAKRRLGLAGRLVLGFVGFMRDWHGLERVVDLLAEPGHEGWHLLLVGDGPARARLLRHAERLAVGDRVTVTGVVDRDHVAAYIAAFDIALQPDVVAYASPLKLFEYLALGRVIVAPASANIREILRDGESAILFSPDERGAFAAAVRKAAEDGALRARVAAGARETIAARGLTWAENARRVEALINGLAKPRPPAGAGGEVGNKPVEQRRVL
jgi:glycosyltransferase involved in cell wall biosynthesis